MIRENAAAICVLPYATTATNATHSMTFDTRGWDYANVFLGMNTHATNKAALSVCKFTEGDTTTAGTAIVALTGGTVTSSSVGFKIPSAVYMGPGAGIEFQIDLRPRKRYLKLDLTPGDATALGTYAIAKLGRGKDSADYAALTVAGVTTGNNEKYIKNYASATSNTSVSTIVSA